VITAGVKRVCVVGAESTGTTSLARDLAARYRAVWVPEYGRDYTEMRKTDGQRIEWRSEEFVHIALQQQKNEDAMAKRANQLLFCDTDALATAIWHERYMGNWSVDVERIADNRKYALYLLTAPDIPFVQDRIRDGELLREWMTDRFRVELTRRGHKWVYLAGTFDQRMATAVREVDKIVSSSAITSSSL
jgi:HTH-type transcriptional regulator, transcriptional repressor of NAD biosynthesis genes